MLPEVTTPDLEVSSVTQITLAVPSVKPMCGLGAAPELAEAADLPEAVVRVLLLLEHPNGK